MSAGVGVRMVTVHSNCIDYLDTIGGSCYTLGQSSTKRADTVGQPPSTEIGVPNMLSLKAKKLSKLPREKVLLEL